MTINFGRSPIAQRSHDTVGTSQLSSRSKPATKSAIASVPNIDKELAASDRAIELHHF
ncbi:hypothetical protein [Microcoleus sp. S13_C5]|uniref:hypothetical protein n=1 Tax=Microcoleus sp. S13_C5 TaxID=3055411 RepID=UPI002FD2F001